MRRKIGTAFVALGLCIIGKESFGLLDVVEGNHKTVKTFNRRQQMLDELQTELAKLEVQLRKGHEELQKQIKYVSSVMEERGIEPPEKRTLN